MILALLLLFNLAANTLHAQKVMKNNKGEVIVKYEDGSWRYYDPKDQEDIALLEEQNRRVKARNEEKRRKLAESESRITEQKVERKTKKTKLKSPKNKSQKLAKTKKPKKNKSGTLNPKSKKSKLAKTKKAKKAKKDRNTFQTDYTGKNYREDIKRIIIETRDQKLKVSEKERKALFQKNMLSEKLAVAKKRKLGKIKIKSLENKIAVVKLDLKEAGKKSKFLTKKRKAYSKILNEDPYAQAIIFNKLSKKYNYADLLENPKESYADEEPSYSEDLVQTAKKKSKRIKKPSLKKNKEDLGDSQFDFTNNTQKISWPSETRDVINNPPSKKCQIAFQGIDSFSGKKRKDLSPALFFSHTDSRMQKFFLDKDMLECNAYLSAIGGGNVFLSLNITIATETAKTSYGSIEKGSLLSLKLLNGENINMTNNQTDPGFLDPIAKTTTYKVTYMIPTQHVKTLQKNEIDLVRIVWGTGYEDYEIYETDFIMEQMTCLTK